MPISKKDLNKVFKNRLNTQRRTFNLGLNQKVIISPTFISSASGLKLNKYINPDEIKIYIDNTGNYLLLNEIENIFVDKSDFFCVEFKENLETKFSRIYSCDFFGSYNEIKCDTSKSKDINVLINQLTLDHSPSMLGIILVYYKNNRLSMSSVFKFSKNAFKILLARGKPKKDIYSLDVLRDAFATLSKSEQQELIVFYKSLYTQIIKDNKGSILKKISNINIVVSSKWDNTSAIKLDTLKYLNDNYFECECK